MSKYNGMKRAGDWEGKKIRTTRDLSNGIGSWPKGTLAIVRSVGPKLRLQSQSCSCCGVKLNMSKVDYYDVELA